MTGLKRGKHYKRKLLIKSFQKGPNICNIYFKLNLFIFKYNHGFSLCLHRFQNQNEFHNLLKLLNILQ